MRISRPLRIAFSAVPLASSVCAYSASIEARRPTCDPDCVPWPDAVEAGASLHTTHGFTVEIVPSSRSTL